MSDLWERIKYEAWWVSRVAPRLRFCKGRRHCLRLVTAYPMVRPTVCRKHRREDILRVVGRERTQGPARSVAARGDAMNQDQLRREFLRIAAELKTHALEVQGRIEAGIKRAEEHANGEGE